MGHGRSTGGGAVAGEHADEAGRHAFCAGAQHAEGERGQGGQLGRLQHHRVSGADGGRDLPAGGEYGRVPGRDLHHGADGLVAGIVEVGGGNRDHLAVELVAPAGIILEHLRHLGDLAAGVADGLAGGEGLQLRQRLGVLTHQAGDLPHGTAARGGGHLPPRRLPGAGRVHGGVDDALTGIGIAGDDAAVGGIDEIERGASAGHNLAGDNAADAPVRQEAAEKCSDARGRRRVGSVEHQTASFVR